MLFVLVLVALGRVRAARELAAFVPDCIVLGKRLLADRRVPRRAKAAIALLVSYLASPIDLVPDFIPVVGQLDDAIVLMVAMRYVTRTVGRELLEELWPGSPRGLGIVLALVPRDKGTSPKS